MRFYKKNRPLIYLLSIFLLLFSFLFSITPGIKGDIEKSIKIALNQPTLFKTKLNTNSQLNLELGDYPLKLFYALKNYFLSSNEFPNFKIDIKFMELEKLKADRRKALSYKKLFNPQKANITIIFNDEKYKATARLKGDLSEHWGNHKQWSLRIKLKNKKTLLSMNEFSLTVFEERAYPYNFVISEVLRENGILSPRYEIIQTSVNGENWGLMLLEEQFSDSFYAFNKLKEAPIFKMTNENDFLIYTIAQDKIKNISDIVRWQGKLETKIYNEKNITKKTNIPGKTTNNNLISIFKNLQEIEYLRDEKYFDNLKNHIDIKLYARILAILSAFGDYHSHKSTNARYYLNPYDLKIIPILTDSTPSNISNKKKSIKFLNGTNLFYKIFYKDDSFQEEYFLTLNKLQNEIDLIEKKFSKVCQPFGENCRNLVDMNTIEENIRYLNENRDIFDSAKLIDTNNNQNKNFDTTNIQDLNKKKINFRVFDNGKIFVDNLTSENIEIRKFSLLEKKKCKNKCQSKKIETKLSLAPSKYDKLTSKEFKIKIDNEAKEKFKYLKISYSNKDNKDYSTTERIENSHYIKSKFFDYDKTSLNKNIQLLDKSYIFNQGEHIVKKPIIIPDGFDLIINEGTSLNMLANTYIFVKNGTVKFNGSENKPININSINDDILWNGIYINSDAFKNKKSVLKNVNISNFTYFDNKNIQLTGGLNFINSNADLSNIQISKSFAEDAINFVNSKFNLNSIKIDEAISDGIDVDFGEGNIYGSKFTKIGGDAIDFSGSNIFLEDVVMKNIKDKAISVGEKTIVNGKNLSISNAWIGIASKDSSDVTIENVVVTNCGLYDFATYQKKSYFSGASMKVANSNSCNKPLSQLGSNLIIDGIEIEEEKIDIKKKLYN